MLQTFNKSKRLTSSI